MSKTINQNRYIKRLYFTNYLGYNHKMSLFNGERVNVAHLENC